MPTIRSRPHLFPVWPAVLVTLTLGVVLVLAWRVYTLDSRQRDAARETLRDYGEFAAWSLERHAVAALEDAFWPFLGRVNHGVGVHTNPKIPPTEAIGHPSADDSAGCACPVSPYQPTLFFGFTLGTDTIRVVRNPHSDLRQGVAIDASDGPGDPESAPLPDLDSDARAWAIDSLTLLARRSYESRWRMQVVPRAGAAGVALVGFTLMPTAWGDTVLYGMVLAPAEVRRIFDDIMALPTLLPEPFRARSREQELLHATVRTAGGEEAYATGIAPEGLLPATRTLEPRAGGLLLSAGFRPSAVANPLLGPKPGSERTLLLGLLLLAGSLAVVASVQLRRESQITRLRSDFVAAVSHELRTPLAQVWLYFDTLRLGRFRTDEQRDHAVGRIEGELSRLTHLVDTVLHFARIEHGETGGARTLVVLGAEIREAVALFQPLAQAAGATLRVDVDDEIAVRVDRRQLRQILINLLDNAVKYGPTGQEVTISASLEYGHVRVAVEDQGPGVAPRDRERIWEPFRRGTSSVERSVGGTGIGLSVVRDVVERYAGSASVEDAPGGGARFVVRLPAERLSGVPHSMVPAGTGENGAGAVAAS